MKQQSIFNYTHSELVINTKDNYYKQTIHSQGKLSVPYFQGDLYSFPRLKRVYVPIEKDPTMKHYYQASGITCGPTSIRMVLSSFGVFKSEQFLASLCGTKFPGTETVGIMDCLQLMKCSAVANSNSNIRTMKKYLAEGYKIIIGYRYGRSSVGHYSVCTHIDKNTIYLADPMSGPNKKINLGYFRKKMWKLGDHKDGNHWFVAIKRETVKK